METSYSQKRNYALIYELQRKIAKLQQGKQTAGNYFSGLRGMWEESSHHRPPPFQLNGERILNLES